MTDSIEEKRSRYNRRWEPGAGFPLRDSEGLIVVTDRRRISDRRLCNTSFEDRLVMFAGLAHWDKE